MDDIILVMGKGNEQFMSINGENIIFNDKNFILDLIKTL